MPEFEIKPLKVTVGIKIMPDYLDATDGEEVTLRKRFEDPRTKVVTFEPATFVFCNPAENYKKEEDLPFLSLPQQSRGSVK